MPESTRRADGIKQHRVIGNLARVSGWVVKPPRRGRGDAGRGGGRIRDVRTDGSIVDGMYELPGCGRSATRLEPLLLLVTDPGVPFRAMAFSKNHPAPCL